MKALILIFTIIGLTACGESDDKPRYFEVNGELKQCTVIGQDACGLTIACPNDGIYECVTN